MASFCSNCGTPASGRFCAACGAAILGEPAPVQVAALTPPPATGTSAAAKIILIVVGVLVLLGGMVVGGLVYAGYRAKQKIAELKRDYGVTGETGSSSSANARSFPPPKGSGCRMLEGQEAAAILGVAVERVEFAANGPDDSEWCRYWVNSTERRRLLAAEIASGVNQVGSADSKSGTEGVEKLIGGALGAVIEGAGDNKNEDFAFSLQVWRNGGKAMWDKMESAKADVKGLTGVDFAGLATQQAVGVGDRSMVLPGGHSVMVLKGDVFFLLGFQQFVPGREKTIALAREVAERI